MEVLTAIIPLFAIIALGWAARRRGFIPDTFLEPANRLVYCFSIPALIFAAVAKIPFRQHFDYRVVSLTLLAIVGIYLLAYLVTRCSGMSAARSGAFILSSAHSNVGYLGLPIAYYYLDSGRFASTGILCGFIMIVQNILSVTFLQLRTPTPGRPSGGPNVIKALGTNPVILGAVAGMAVSLATLALPPIVWRIIDILGGLAPPLALLLIGASLSLRPNRKALAPTLAAAALKLLLLPALAVLLFFIFHLEAGAFLPAVILLGSPAATIVYVLVRGAGSDSDFAVTQISLGTIFSCVTLSLWLALIPLLETHHGP